MQWYVRGSWTLFFPKPRLVGMRKKEKRVTHGIDFMSLCDTDSWVAIVPFNVPQKE